MKPSIFSNNYRKVMRRRRIIRNICISIVVLLIASVFIMHELNIKLNLNSTAGNDKNKTDVANNPTQKPSGKDNSASTAGNQTTNTDEQGYVFTLSSGLSVKAVYETQDNVKKFKTVDPIDSSFKYYISPQGTGMVILDSKTQNLTYIDSEGTQKDITYKQYTDQQGNAYPKDDVIKNNTGYIWCDEPRFIDENTIVYLSMLPWIGEGQKKYVWIYNIKNNTYNNVYSVGGDSVNFDVVTDKGITVTVDSKTVYVNADGGVSEK